MTHSTFLPSATCSFLTLCLAASGLANGLRPLSTDRPDTTESPHTVDAGHFQLEMEIANASREGRAREMTLGELNAKLGLDHQTDLQIVMPFFTQVRNGGEGYGDTEIRLKRNLWGNDEGSTAFALMPFLKLPTADSEVGNGDLEGGLIAPFGFDGPADWSCAVMAEVDLESDEDGSGYHVVGLVSATASHAVTETTGMFLELVALQAADSDAELEAYFNCGMTWAISPTWQLDGGARTGLTAEAVNFTPFLGISTKF